MRVGDVYVQARRTCVRLQEKGGKQHEIPCHRNLDEMCTRMPTPRGAPVMTEVAVQDDRGAVWSAVRTANVAGGHVPVIGPRAAAAAAEVWTKIWCHSVRAIWITKYRRNGGELEVAQQMANHESSRTTGLYDKKQDGISLDEAARNI